MAKYNVVPTIITGKDLEYLKDMFNWNIGIYKSNMNSNVKDKELKKIVDKANLVFKTNINKILDILGGKYESK